MTAALALGLATGVTPSPAVSAPAETVELVAGPPSRYDPVQDELYFAGESGYMHSRQNADGLNGPMQWHPYDGGEERTIEGWEDGPSHHVAASTDTIHTAAGLTDLATGETTPFTVPEGQIVKAVFGRTAVTMTVDEYGATTGLHVLHIGPDGQVDDIPVAGPPPDSLNYKRSIPVIAGDSEIAVVRFVQTRALGLIDLATGELTQIPTNNPYLDSALWQVAVSPTHIAWFMPGIYPGEFAYVVPRSDPTAQPTEIEVPPDADGGTPQIGLAGDNLLTTYDPAPDGHDSPLRRGSPLRATPLDGGPTTTLLPHAQMHMTQIESGGAVVVGGDSADDWAVRRIEVAADGSLSLRALDKVPPRLAKVGDVALAGGRLVTAEQYSAPRPAMYQRDVTLHGTPGLGERSMLTSTEWEPDYARPRGTGDGRFVHARWDQATEYSVLVTASSPEDRTEYAYPERTPPYNIKQALDASGRYVLIGHLDGRGAVIDLEAGDGGEAVEGATGTAVWGTKYWKPAAAGFESHDLKSGAVQRYALDNVSCTVQYVQVVGRWVYWDCRPPNVTGGGGDPFGIRDLQTGRDIPLPMRGRLGDGFVVRDDEATDRLLLTDFHTGTAEEPRVLAQVSTPTGIADFDVDKFGGGIAYREMANVHVLPTGVPTQPLAKIESRVDDSADLASATDRTWDGVWQLSKPATDAELVVKDSAGRTVRSLAATPSGAALTARWDGTADTGAYAPDGTYTWELTATPVDGRGDELTLTGDFTLSGSAH